MKSAIKRPIPNSITPDNDDAHPAISVRCRHCSRQFAKVSAESDLELCTPHEQACAACEPFLGLYDTLKTREQEYTALLSRGPKHHGRIQAHMDFRKAKVAMENFMVNIEALNDVSFDMAQAGSANRTKPLSVDGAPGEAKRLGENQCNLDDASRSAEQRSSTVSSPTTNRKSARNSDASNLKRKRIKFGEDVEERPAYRTTLDYYRGAKDYAPGRYAVTEGAEYEDTSGSTISFTKFTGQRKVKSTFVDVVPKAEPQDKRAQTSVAKKIGKRSEKESEKSDTPQIGEIQVTSRELRSRRVTSIDPLATTRPRKISAQYDGQEDPEESTDVPALVIAMEAPDLCELRAWNSDDQLAPVSEHDDGVVRPHGADEHASIKKVVSIVQRELRCLEQTAVSPEHIDMVSKAVCACLEALEPLENLYRTHLNHNREAVEPQQEEEASIYFEASDGTCRSISMDVPCPDDSSEPTWILPKWTDAQAHNPSSGESAIGLALDANVLDGMPKEDRQNLSGVREFEKEGEGLRKGIDQPASAPKAIEDRARHTEMQRVKKARTESDNHQNGRANPPEQHKCTPQMNGMRHQ